MIRYAQRDNGPRALDSALNDTTTPLYQEKSASSEALNIRHKIYLLKSN